MSVTPGNDPFSGSNTKNILQHIISPKIVDVGSGAYAIKTDLINIDNAYVANDIYSNGYIPPPLGLSAGVGTVTPINIQEAISGTNGVALIQAGPYVGTNPSSLNGLARISFNTDLNTNATTINLQANSGSGVATALSVSSTNVNSTGTITGSNLLRKTQSGVTHDGVSYKYTDCTFPLTKAGMYQFYAYTTNLDEWIIKTTIHVPGNSGGTASSVILGSITGDEYYNAGGAAVSLALVTSGSNGYLEDTGTHNGRSFDCIIQQIC